MSVDESMRRGIGVLAVFVLMAVAVGATGMVTAQTSSAPDCSTVPYNGDGTEANPYEISNVSQLQCIEQQGLDDNYEIVSDIDASGTSSWNDGDGFEPIGAPSVLGQTFGGTLEGEGHTIDGLTVNRSNNDSVAVFTILTGEVDGVVLENADVEGNSSVGVIAGQVNVGSINASSATGDVVGSTTVGGLAGYNLGSGAVENSSATVEVDGGNQSGGLLGQNDGAVRNSYSRGSVTGDDAVGGLIGFNGLSGGVSTSYATGTVSANSNSGGLIGININVFGTVADDSYWDTQSTGQSSSAADGTGLTTSEMTGSAATGNMTEFDFAGIWKTVTDPDDYPILVWQEETDDGNGGGGGDGGGTIDEIQTSLSDMDGDNVSDRVQADVTVSDVTGRTIVEFGEDNFDVDVSPTDTGQATFVTPRDPDGDGTNETVEFVPFGATSTTYTVIADLSNQSDGETGTVDVELDSGATDTATYTVEEVTGPLDPSNPFADSAGNPIGRGAVVDKVVEWNLNREIDGTSYTREEIINFVVQWNTAT